MEFNFSLTTILQFTLCVERNGHTQHTNGQKGHVLHAYVAKDVYIKSSITLLLLHMKRTDHVIHSTYLFCSVTFFVLLISLSFFLSFFLRNATYAFLNQSLISFTPSCTMYTAQQRTKRWRKIFYGIFFLLLFLQKSSVYFYLKSFLLIALNHFAPCKII